MSLGYPFIGYPIGTIDHIVIPLFAKVRTYKFSHDFMIRRHLEKPTIRAFRNQRIPSGHTLSGTNETAVELACLNRRRKSGFNCRMLSDHLY